MNGYCLSFSLDRLTHSVERDGYTITPPSPKRMAFCSVLRKLTVCRHWTLDRLPVRGFAASVVVSLAMALVRIGRVFV